MKKTFIALLILSSFLALSAEDKKPTNKLSAQATKAINEVTQETQKEREKLAQTLHTSGYEAITLGGAALGINLGLELAYSAGNPILTAMGAGLAGFGCWLVFNNRAEARRIRAQKIRESVVESLNPKRK